MNDISEAISPIKPCPIEYYEMAKMQGRTYYCLASGMDAHSFAHSAAREYLHDTGLYITPEGKVQEVHLSEIVVLHNAETEKDEIGIVLPVPGVCTFLDYIVSTQQAVRQREKRLRTVYRLFLYFITAYTCGAVDEHFFRAAVQTPLCFLTDEKKENLIILPPQLVFRCVTAQAKRAFYFHYLWTHPDAAQMPFADTALFFLASLSYAGIMGVPPFNDDAIPFADTQTHGTIEKLIENIRDGVFIPLKLCAPYLFSEYTYLIDAGLHIDAKKTVPERMMLVEKLCCYRDDTLPLFVDSQSSPIIPAAMHDESDNDTAHCAANTFFATDGMCTEALCTGTKGAGTAGMKSSEAATVFAFVHTMRRRILRRRFFMRNRSRIIVCTITFCVVMTIATSFVQYLLKPPLTAGMTREAVVHGFYTALADLDPTITGAYTKNNAGAAYDSLILHLYVMGKTREAYERKKIYYTPQEFFSLWRAALLSCTKATDTAKDKSAGTVKNYTDTVIEDSPSGTVKGGQKANKLHKNHPNTHTQNARIPHALYDAYKEQVVKALHGGSVYGISGLQITPSMQKEWFDVWFYHWLPIFSEKEMQTVEQSLEGLYTDRRARFPLQIFYKHDKVQIITVKNSFFIGTINPVQSIAVCESSDKVLKCMASAPETVGLQ